MVSLNAQEAAPIKPATQGTGDKGDDFVFGDIDAHHLGGVFVFPQSRKGITDFAAHIDQRYECGKDRDSENNDIGPKDGKPAGGPACRGSD